MSLTGFALVRPVAITDAMLIADDVPEADAPAWNAATAYALDDLAMRALPGLHRVYKRRVAGTTATAPENDPTNWLFVSSTNRWKKFDTSIGSETTRADSMTFTLQPGTPITALYLGNVSSASAHVVVTDPVEGVVYDATKNTAPDLGINDWYAYFFEPIVRGTDLLFDDLPPYIDATITVTLTDAGNTVGLGVCLIGLARQWGGTKYGAAVGIKDYSRKDNDAFGGFQIVQRDFSKRARLPVQIDNQAVDALHRMLSELRATPVLYIGSSLYTSTLIYGFFRDFEIVIPSATTSECSIEVEGLT